MVQELNPHFTGLKSELLALHESMSNKKVYQDFHAYLALIADGKEAHAYVDDYDNYKISNRLRYGKDSYQNGQDGICLRLSMSVNPDVGLQPIGEYAMYSLSSIYQDEWSNQEGRSYPNHKECKCYVCHLKSKPEILWTHLDYAAGSAITEFVMKFLQGDGCEPQEIKIKRTPDELKVLTDHLKEKFEQKKSLQPIMDLAKSLVLNGDKTINEVKAIIQSKMRYANIDVDKLVKSDDWAIFSIKDNIDQPVVDIMNKSYNDTQWQALEGLRKAAKGSSKSGHKYLRREGSAGNYTYIYEDDTGREVSGEQPKKIDPAKSDTEKQAGHKEGNKLPEHVTNKLKETLLESAKHMLTQPGVYSKKDQEAARGIIDKYGDKDNEENDEAREEYQAEQAKKKESEPAGGAGGGDDGGDDKNSARKNLSSEHLKMLQGMDDSELKAELKTLSRESFYLSAPSNAKEHAELKVFVDAIKEEIADRKKGKAGEYEEASKKLHDTADALGDKPEFKEAADKLREQAGKMEKLGEVAKKEDDEARKESMKPSESKETKSIKQDIADIGKDLDRVAAGAGKNSDEYKNLKSALGEFEDLLAEEKKKGGDNIEDQVKSLKEEWASISNDLDKLTIGGGTGGSAGKALKSDLDAITKDLMKLKSKLKKK